MYNPKTEGYWTYSWIDYHIIKLTHKQHNAYDIVIGMLASLSCGSPWNTREALTVNTNQSQTENMKRGCR